MILPWEQQSDGGDISSLLKLLQQNQGQQTQYTGQPTTMPANNGSNNIGNIIKSLAGARYNFQGVDTKPQQQGVDQLNNYADAITNSDNPTYQRVYGQEKEAGQQDLARTIFELSNQNRKLSQLGRTPLFDNERGGEQQFRALTQGYQDVQNQARDRARSIIGAGATATNNALSAQNNLTAMKEKNRQSQAFGAFNIADALPFLKML